MLDYSLTYTALADLRGSVRSRGLRRRLHTKPAVARVHTSFCRHRTEKAAILHAKHAALWQASARRFWIHRKVRLLTATKATHPTSALGPLRHPPIRRPTTRTHHSGMGRARRKKSLRIARATMYAIAMLCLRHGARTCTWPLPYSRRLC